MVRGSKKKILFFSTKNFFSTSTFSSLEKELVFSYIGFYSMTYPYRYFPRLGKVDVEKKIFKKKKKNFFFSTTTFSSLEKKKFFLGLTLGPCAPKNAKNGKILMF